MPKRENFSVCLVAKDTRGETMILIRTWQLKARSLPRAKMEVDRGVWDGLDEGNALEIVDGDGNVVAVSMRGATPYLGAWMTPAK